MACLWTFTHSSLRGWIKIPLIRGKIPPIRGKGETQLMATAHFSKGAQFYQFDDDNEFNSVIKRLYQVMNCQNTEGIAEYLRINNLEIIDSFNNKKIPVDWFKIFFFVVYAYIDELENGNKQYNDKEYFNKKYDEFIQSITYTRMEDVIKYGKGAMLADGSIEPLSMEQVERIIYELVSKEFESKD